MTHTLVSDVPVVGTIDPTSFPEGAVTNVLLDMAHDGLGIPVRIPVMVARGRRPGPVFGITSALHGNELNGIPVIHQLLRKLDVQRLKGTVVAAVVVNVPGFHAETRVFHDGRDPNHHFPGSPDGFSSEIYAHRLMERIISPMEVLVDLHTASFGRVNCLYARADLTQEGPARLALLQRPHLIVHKPGSDGTLRGAVADLGRPAVTLEIGNPHRFQPEYIRRSATGLRATLAAWGMVSARPLKPVPPPVVCSRSFWMYTDHGGLLQVLPRVTEHVEAGEPIARLTDAFGNTLREYTAPEAGVVIGHSVNPVAFTGSRILHLGIPAAQDGVQFPHVESNRS